MAKRANETKRTRITKAQRVTLAEVLVASLICGACIVVANFLIKFINFNTKIITAKNTAIGEYDQTLRNVGICVDKDKNSRLDDKEIDECRPESVELDKVRGSLRYNIYELMAKNENLELVARKRDEGGVCYDEKDELIDFTRKYTLAKTDKEREQALDGMKICSALRVVPDALPSKKNVEALMSSLNQLFIEAKVEPMSLTPQGEVAPMMMSGIGTLPVTMMMEGSALEMMSVLRSLERSVREFDIKTAQVEWAESGGLEFRAGASAYYLDEYFAPETMIRVRASGESLGTKSQSLELWEPTSSWKKANKK